MIKAKEGSKTRRASGEYIDSLERQLDLEVDLNRYQSGLHSQRPERTATA